MYYKINKNKIKFYKIEVDERIEKIKNKIIKKHGRKEHRNLITTSLFNPIEKDAMILNFSYKHRFFLLGCEYDYDIIYYPKIIKELDAVLEKQEYKNLSFLRKYQIPSKIKNLEESRYKNNLIKREYPYDAYIKEIRSCFHAVFIKEVEFTDEIDMLSKILETLPNKNHKIKQKDIKNLLENKELSFLSIEESQCYL